ncbi:MAG: membrane dipeptidase [Dehalococcoidia bacterium]
MVTGNQARLFDYGLAKDQEKRARHLHEDSIIINMLALGLVGSEAFTGEMNKQLKDDYELFHDFWVRTQGLCMSMPVEMAIRGEFPALKEWWDISGVTASVGQVRTPLDIIYRDIALWTLGFDNADWLVKVRKTDDIRRSKAEGKHGAFLYIQCMDWQGDLDILDTMSRFGVKGIQLTYNNMNIVGAGCTERTDAGISNFGAMVIQRMNQLGMLVDTGHCGHQTTLDACALSKQPVIASHTMAKGVYNHDRAKSDDALVALAKTGGVIGIAITPFLISDAEVVTMEHYLNQLDYVVRLVGWEHVGIGTDWPFQLPDWALELMTQYVVQSMGFRKEHRFNDIITTHGYIDCRDFINITRGLVARGYTDEQIRAILGGNWLRVMDAVWK